MASGRLAFFLSDPESVPGFSERLALAVSGFSILLGFGLVGWVLGFLIRLSVDLLNLQADRFEVEVRAVDFLEHRIAPALDRLARAIEQSESQKSESIHSTSSHLDDQKENRKADQSVLIEALQANDWERVKALTEAYARDHAEDPELTSWLQKVAKHKDARVDELKARLVVARQVGDPEQVLAYRSELVLILDREEREVVDREAIGWLMSLIHKRLRAGTIGPELALLAGRVSESFAETTEGASLRAALPTLRRSAGLCPRCVEPYTGVAEACPQCLNHDSSHDHEHWPDISKDSFPPSAH